jgi:CubicO group peptidase (beta-lactamase class C family)
MMRYPWAYVATFLIVLSAGAVAADHPAHLPAAKIEKIEAAISAARARLGIPGLSVAIVADQHVLWSKGFGLADVENSVPCKSATVYRLASISKAITAVAVMQLAERGKLDLDTPVQKYCPAFPEKPWPITARQLLGHLGGIRHYKNQEEFDSTRHYTNMSRALEVFKNDPLLFEPGTKFFYTTFGYNLLGCMIEGATGMTYVDYVHDNIFRPAGMEHIRIDDVYAIIPHRAEGYRKTTSGELQNAALSDTSIKIPGGGFASTVVDLAKFAMAVQTDMLVNKNTLDQMFTRQRTRDGRETPYGLGWYVGAYNGQRAVWHIGNQQGASTILYMLPDQRFAVALMTNLEGLVQAVLSDLTRQIADITLVSTSQMERNNPSAADTRRWP